MTALRTSRRTWLSLAENPGPANTVNSVLPLENYLMIRTGHPEKNWDSVILNPTSPDEGACYAAGGPPFTPAANKKPRLESRLKQNVDLRFRLRSLSRGQFLGVVARL